MPNSLGPLLAISDHLAPGQELQNDDVVDAGGSKIFVLQQAPLRGKSRRGQHQ